MRGHIFAHTRAYSCTAVDVGGEGRDGSLSSVVLNFRSLK